MNTLIERLRVDILFLLVAIATGAAFIAVVIVPLIMADTNIPLKIILAVTGLMVLSGIVIGGVKLFRYFKGGTND